MYCEKCGAKLPDGAGFCPKCGYDVRGGRRDGHAVNGASPSSTASFPVMEPEQQVDPLPVGGGAVTSRKRPKSSIIPVLLGAGMVAAVIIIALAVLPNMPGKDPDGSGQATIVSSSDQQGDQDKKDSGQSADASSSADGQDSDQSRGSDASSDSSTTSAPSSESGSSSISDPQSSDGSSSVSGDSSFTPPVGAADYGSYSISSSNQVVENLYGAKVQMPSTAQLRDASDSELDFYDQYTGADIYLSVCSSNGQTLDDVYASLKDKASQDSDAYKTIDRKKGFCVVSYEAGDLIFYRMVYVKNGGIEEMTIGYPTSNRAVGDKMVEEVQPTFLM